MMNKKLHNRWYFIVPFAIMIGTFITKDLAMAGKSSELTQQQIKQAEQAPLQIDARGGLKCDRTTQKCVARDHVRVQKGIFVMYCDELTAFLFKQQDGRSVVRRIDARGQVRFTGAPGEKGSASRALYDLASNSITLTGRQDELGEQEMTACMRGWWPIVQRDQHVLCAQTLTIRLDQNNSQGNRIKGMDAQGGSLFSTPIEFSTSDSIVYDVETKQAILRGDVIVDRNEGQIKGPYGLLDFATNQHQVLRYDPLDMSCELSEKPMAFIRVKNVDRRALKPTQ